MPTFRELRAAYRSMIVDQRPDAFLTFNLYHALPAPVLLRLVKDFLNRMQRKVDGRNWPRIPSEDRPRAVGSVEHLLSNTHAHAVAASGRYLDFVFSDAAQALWRRCHANAGQFDARSVTDSVGVGGYTLKELRCTDDFDRVIIYAPTRSTSRSRARH